MKVEVVMPKWAEMTEGTIVAWKKNVGDNVKANEPIAEIETEKINTEIEAVVDGVLTEIFCQAGDTVKVGTTIAIIEKD